LRLPIHKRAMLAALCLLTLIPTNSAVGSTSYEKCYRLTEDCAPLKEGEYVLLAGDTWDSGHAVLADVATDRAAVCKLRILKQVARDRCPNNTPAASVVAALLAIIGNIVLVLLVCCANPRNRSIACLVIYWGNDFWAGMLAAAFVNEAFCTRGNNSLGSWAIFICGAMVVELLMYDVPLLVGKRCCSAWAFATVAACLGSFYGFFAYVDAYDPASSIAYGHHMILFGLLMWLIDFVKKVVEYNVLRCLCCCCMEGDYAVYRPLVSELVHPLPKDVQESLTGKDGFLPVE